MCPPELDNVVLKALARNRDDRFASAAEMADALDDVVHASRFQPGHLAQQLHDLFPLEGGGGTAAPPHRPPTHTTNPSHPSAGRSPTIQPITRSSSRGAPFDNPAAVDSLRPKRSRLAIVVGAAAVLGVGGFFVWKGTSARGGSDPAVHAPVPNDPSRRFNIYVKSEPPGADIVLDGKSKPVGATPISLPIDLNGVSSVQMMLKKPGYEDYQQIITTDSPISINLQPLERPAEQKPPAETPPAPAAAAAESEEAAPGDEGGGDSQAKAKRHGKEAPKRPGGRKGEIVDPF
jgi:serine/threonine-protein kinase